MPSRNPMMLLHPQFLYGLAGVSLPILIHLLARRRAKRVQFPSLRLLKAAERKRRTFARLQRPLSLLLRVIAVALLALALAGPVVGRLPGWLPLPRPQAIAVVLDDSLSMSAGTGVETPFARAKRAAHALLNALGPHDRVAVIPASCPEAAEWRSPIRASRKLAACRATALPAKMGPAMMAAARALEQADTANRTVVLLTDLQASAWSDPPVEAERLDLSSVFIVDVGNRKSANVSVDAISMLSPTLLIGRPIRLSARASASYAGKPHEQTQKIVLQLIRDNGALAASEQEVAPDRPAAAQFSLLADKAGDITLRVVLAGGPYGLPTDDVRYCTVRVRRALRVLVVTPGADRGAGKYISTALDPFKGTRPGGISPKVVEPSELSRAMKPGAVDVLILANCPRLEEPAEKALESHLDAGGGVLIFLGDDIAAEFYNDELLPRITDDSSASLGPVMKTEPGAPFFLTEIDTSKPPLSPFANPAAGDLGALRFTKIRALEVGPKADVLARFDNGLPALVQWHPGRGRICVFNTSADGSWGEHIKSPAYVPLLHLLCSHLARPARPVVADVEVGERPALTGVDSPPDVVTLVRPDGRSQTINVEDGLLPEVKEPGVYRVRWGEHEVAFAANVDSRESDMRRVSPEAVRTAMQPVRMVFVPADRAARIATQLPARVDLSWPLLLMVLAIVLFESVFSIIRREPADQIGRQVGVGPVSR